MPAVAAEMTPGAKEDLLTRRRLLAFLPGRVYAA